MLEKCWQFYEAPHPETLPLLARMRHAGPVCRCPLIGADRKWLAEG